MVICFWASLSLAKTCGSIPGNNCCDISPFIDENKLDPSFLVRPDIPTLSTLVDNCWFWISFESEAFCAVISFSKSTNE